MRGRLAEYVRSFRLPFVPWLWKAHLYAIAGLALFIPMQIYLGNIRIPPLINGMAWQPKAKAQSTAPVNSEGQPFFSDGVTQRRPVPGTIPREYSVYPYQVAVYGVDEARNLAGQNLFNPLSPTIENLRMGERVFDTYCQPCHGYKGLADGSAVGPGRLAAPNSLHSDIARGYKDGHIFHIVTVGQNKMPSYAWPLNALQRWAAVHHVRVLQRAVNPLPGDLPGTSALSTQAGTTESLSIAPVPEEGTSEP
ncbi:cytochrome c [bacterium]|nr:cytochrome c [bacterium]